MFEIIKYTEERKEEWNCFINNSKTVTFLFNRNYMDYHSDRFTDHSAIVLKNNRIYALFPANSNGDTIYSHQGLTYGGLITNNKATVKDVCEIFKLINGTLAEEGFRNVVYKHIPWIYNSQPAEETLYALTNCCKAHITARDISSTIFMDNRIKFAESRRSGIRKAIANGIEVTESNDIDTFWKILENNLANRYTAKPVHTAEEMKLLKSRFPDNIKLYVTRKGQETVGGTVLYIMPKVVHTQYISASEEGKRLGALDILFDMIINRMYTEYDYFDFGKSTEDGGKYLNESLIFQKEGFGGRGICYDTYEWTL